MFLLRIWTKSAHHSKVDQNYFFRNFSSKFMITCKSFGQFSNSSNVNFGSRFEVRLWTQSVLVMHIQYVTMNSLKHFSGPKLGSRVELLISMDHRVRDILNRFKISRSEELSDRMSRRGTFGLWLDLAFKRTSRNIKPIWFWRISIEERVFGIFDPTNTFELLRTRGKGSKSGLNGQEVPDKNPLRPYL